MKLFQVTDLGKWEFFLGVKIQDGADGITLSQSSLISRILHDTGMAFAKPTKTPIRMGHSIYDERRELTDDQAEFMQNVR